MGRFFKSVSAPLIILFIIAIYFLHSRESRSIWLATALFFGTIGGPWMTYRAVKGGNAALYPYFQAWRGENPTGFWSIVAFYLLASAMCALLFMTVIDPKDFTAVRSALSWQRYWTQR